MNEPLPSAIAVGPPSVLDSAYPCPRCGAVLPTGAAPLADPRPGAPPAAPRSEKRDPVPRAVEDSTVCPRCGEPWVWRHGMLDVRPDAEPVRRFVEEYETVRLAEGRGGQAAEALRELPWARATDPFAWEWYVRAQSWDHFREQFLPRFRAARAEALATDPEAPLDVLDLGAGIGWLSYRLALDGHRGVAVDLSAHPQVGLGAAGAYLDALERPFERWLAHFDSLPSGDGRFDLIVYNASFHYSADYARTLEEALRCLAPHGAVVIMDSPIYRDAAHGERMVAERQAAFRARYGFASSALGSREFLTYAEVDALAGALGLRWALHRPKRGWSWRWHRMRRRWATGRPSAEFSFLVARRREESEA